MNIRKHMIRLAVLICRWHSHLHGEALKAMTTNPMMLVMIEDASKDIEGAYEVMMAYNNWYIPDFN